MNAISRIARTIAIAAGAALLATAILVSIEVVARWVFLVSFNAGSEISGYVLGIVASWGLAHTLLLRGHVRVDALVRLFPEKLRGWIDLLALLGLGAVGLLLFSQAFVTFVASWTMNSHSMTPLQVPIWIPQALWVAGLGYFVVVLAFLAVQATWTLVKGDYRQARQIIGVHGVEDEAAEALADVRAIAGASGGEPRP